MINRNLYKRLERLEAQALAARGGDENIIAFVNGGSLRPACVIGPDGAYVWWKPPEGCKVSDLVDPQMMLVAFADPGDEMEPTTVMGPDGRLVWLEPPQGHKEGEPIEDSGGAEDSAEGLGLTA
jgi:hypothetical protein